MKSNKPIFIVFSILMFISTQNVFSQNIYKRISAVACDSLIKANTNNPNFVILDVLTPGSWQSEHLEGWINRNVHLKNKIGEFRIHKKIN